MKLLKILALTLASVSLFACNAGDDTTTSSDTQTTELTGNSASGTGAYTIKITAVNCRVSPSNCHVTLNAYSSSGNLNPAIINYAVSGQASSGISGSCPNSIGTNQSCNFTIYGTSTNGQPVTFSFTGTGAAKGNAVTPAAFTIGGGI